MRFVCTLHIVHWFLKSIRIYKSEELRMRTKCCHVIVIYIAKANENVENLQRDKKKEFILIYIKSYFPMKIPLNLHSCTIILQYFPVFFHSIFFHVFAFHVFAFHPQMKRYDPPFRVCFIHLGERLVLEWTFKNLR